VKKKFVRLFQKNTGVSTETSRKHGKNSKRISGECGRQKEKTFKCRSMLKKSLPENRQEKILKSQKVEKKERKRNPATSIYDQQPATGSCSEVEFPYQKNHDGRTTAV
jgi:hypothetical protein